MIWYSILFLFQPRDDTNNDRISEVDHLQAFESRGLTWPPVYSADFEEACGHLIRRRKEIVWYLEQCFPASDFPVESVHDTNLNIKWQDTKLKPISPCIVSTSIPWLRLARRELTGAEALCLQGFDFSVWP